MVSFDKPLSPTQREAIQEVENSSEKRKWEEEAQVEEVSKYKKPTKSMKSMLDTELNLETRLPLEYWQRCLDTKHGEIQYFNTITQNRISKDPTMSPEQPNRSNMSLDLELNLPCGSTKTENHNHLHNLTNPKSGSSSDNSGDRFLNSGPCPPPSWLAVDQGGEEREMVTAVCKKCHMLVMMYKSSPACPNCKFLHPLDQSPPDLFNEPRLSLLC